MTGLEVTKENFGEYAPFIKEKIDQSVFVCEFISFLYKRHIRLIMMTLLLYRIETNEAMNFPTIQLCLADCFILLLAIIDSQYMFRWRYYKNYLFVTL